MTKNMISIIVPIYNTNKEYLTKCLNSIINQTYPKIEILLIDDGSDEWCKNCYEEISQKDNRIKCIVQENQGVSNARNNGIKNANGDWIMFVDADDWLELDCCQKIMDRVEANPNLEILIGKVILNKKETEQKIFNAYDNDKIITTKNDKEELLISILDDNKSKYNYVESVWAKLFKREYLIKNNIFFKEKLRIGEDCLFTYEAYNKASTIYYLNDFIYHYRINENSVSNSFNKYIIENYNLLFNAFLKLFSQEDITYLKEEYMSFGCKQMVRFVKKYYGNCNNPKSYSELKLEFYKLIHSYPYNEFLEQVNLKLFPLKKRMILMLAKRNYFSLLYTMGQLRKEN